MSRFTFATLVGLACTGLASPARADTVYNAYGVLGDPGTLKVGLVLPNFWGANTFSGFEFTSVQFTTTDTGATLVGTIRNTGPSGPNNLYSMNVAFNKVAAPPGSNPDWTYYMIDPKGKELVNLSNPNDYADLFSFPPNGSKPFQVGFGANEVNNNFGAAGWLSWIHYINGQVLRSTDDAPGDFAMDLELVPEPSSLALAFTGLFGFGWAARRRLGRK